MVVNECKPLKEEKCFTDSRQTREMTELYRKILKAIFSMWAFLFSTLSLHAVLESLACAIKQKQ